MNTRRRLIDLAAFLAVLGTGTGLIALGVNPQSLAVIAVAIAGLYSVWLNIDQHADRRDQGSGRKRDRGSR